MDLSYDAGVLTSGGFGGLLRMVQELSSKSSESLHSKLKKLLNLSHRLEVRLRLFASMNYSIAIDFLKDSDPILGQLIDCIGACQLNQHELEGDLFFCLSRSILHQQLSTKVAKVIHQRFLQLYPDTQFPSAQDVLNTPDEVLRNVGISRPKIAYLKDLAHHAIDGLPTLEELEVMDDEAIIKTLTRVKGVGRWTVQMLLIFRLKRWDVLPVDDLGVRAGIRKLYNLDALPDRKTTERFGQKWKPYCSIASWYLWRSLELKPV